MRIPRFVVPAALGIAALLLSTGCITFPQLKDRVVHLSTNGTVRGFFHAHGTLNETSDSQTIRLADSLDVAQLLHDAGIDPDMVDTITVATVTYRVLVPDANPARTITGTVSIQGQPLIDSFSANAGAATGDVGVVPDAAGVGAINTLLGHVLQEVRSGSPITDQLTYGVVGTSSPTDVNTDFVYEIQIKVNIVGHAKTKMIT